MVDVANMGLIFTDPNDIVEEKPKKRPSSNPEPTIVTRVKPADGPIDGETFRIVGGGMCRNPEFARKKSLRFMEISNASFPNGKDWS